MAYADSYELSPGAVLVTGASGFVGGALVRRMLEQVAEDAAHGKRSPVVRLGTQRAASLVPWFVAGSLAFQWAPVLLGQWPLTALLSAAGLPPARALIQLLGIHHAEPERIIGSKFLALRFQALSGLGLALGLAVAPLVGQGGVR